MPRTTLTPRITCGFFPAIQDGDDPCQDSDACRGSCCRGWPAAESQPTSDELAAFASKGFQFSSGGVRLFADGEGSTFETDLDTLRRDHGNDDVERLLAALNAVKSQRLVWTVERDVALLAEVWRTGAVTGIALPTPTTRSSSTPTASCATPTSGRCSSSFPVRAAPASPH